MAVKPPKRGQIKIGTAVAVRNGKPVKLPQYKTKGKGKKKRFLVPLKHAPKGTYGADIDVEAGKLRRGLGDLLEDYDPETGKETLRANQDFLLGSQDIARRKSQAGEDYLTATGDVKTGYERTMADYLAQRGDVDRSFTSLANQQAQAFRAGGLAEGGAALQAAQKRTANRQLALAPIQTAETRAGEDRTRSLDELLRQNQRMMDPKSGTFALEQGQAGQTYQRQTQDIADILRRGRRENVKGLGVLEKERWRQYLDEGGRRKVWVGRKKLKQLRKQKVI